ncbi:hypothetical protein OG596_16350 [Streptomyces sp. NBC_01102]|uniref:hypothetical protein n=1 Tax=Streptomyces sp. NBC_01102 TaxID=2903749 RepID=UPI00386B6E41|nr:hypothetical protein OG596_16350 [Streptomyces sp. NBC_01102]
MPSDVFSPAAALTFAACGYGPFDAESSYAAAYDTAHTPPVLGGVPEPLRSVLARCVAVGPVGPQTAGTTDRANQPPAAP